MALDTVPFYREGGLAVVAGSATLATLHLGHAEMGIVTGCPEQCVVTVTACVHLQMFTVTEGQSAEIWDLDGDISY